MGDYDPTQFISQDYISSDTKYYALTLEKNYVIQTIKIHGYVILNQLLIQNNEYESMVQHIFTHLIPLKTSLLLFYVNYMTYKKQSIPITIHDIKPHDYISRLPVNELIFIIKQLLLEWR